MRNRIKTPLLALAIVVTTSSCVSAQLFDAAGYQSDVQPLINTHCISCHGRELQESSLRLDTLEPDFTDPQTAAMWIEVMDNLNLGEMPSADEPQPSPAAAAKMSNWIAAELRFASARAHSTGRRVLMRRLSRTEYANAVRDLLEVDFLAGEGPRELLPPDGTLDGFDKVSKALLLDPSLMESYLTVASLVAEKAIQTGPPPVPTHRSRMEYENITGGIEYIKHSRTTIVTNDGIITMSQGMRSDDMLRHPWSQTLIPVRGRYRLRVRLGADPKDREALFVRISRRGDGVLHFGKVPGTIERPEIIEFERDFDTPGGDEIGIEFVDAPDFGRVNYHFSDLRRDSQEAIDSGNAKLAGRLRAQTGAQGFPNQGRLNPETRTLEHLPRIFFDWIELEGPLYDQWPPRSTELLFHKGLTEINSDEQLDYAREIFSGLLPRAYRRPVDATEVDSILGVVSSELQNGETFPNAIKAGLVATLCSPAFLMINEPLPANSDNETRQLANHEIAFRLSLFLWSSIPDEELRSAAHSGSLHDRQQLIQQTRRMLKDDRAEALVDGFARQWLKADEFDRFAVDRNLYRDFYRAERGGLNDAINAEPLEFFRQVLNSDGDALDFLDSDWTMANEQLANYYGIQGVTGDHFVKVKLPPETHRGGLTTMAAVHKWGSDGNRTKPVERGKYVLEVLFNDPPKPPPPNVGEVEPNVQGDNLTVRQRLDMHRTIPACANCHRTLDPYGLALENFNVVSQWRTKQDGEREWWPDEAAIDATGVLPNGISYSTVEEFRQALRNQEDRFRRGLAEKLFTYALGRIVEPGDRTTIESLTTHMRQNGNTIRSLIEAIVLSEEFLTK